MHPRGRIGLAAAADAAAGAGHDLDDVVLLLAADHLVEQDLGVLQAVGHADVDDRAAQVDGGLLDPFDAADLVEIDLLQLLPVTSSQAVRSAASITPPVVPKMSAAPDETPSGASNSPSARLWKSMP